MSGGYGSNNFAEALGKKNPLLKHLVKALYPPMPTLNVIDEEKLRAIQAHLFKAGSTVVNVGSSNFAACGYRLWKSEAIASVNVINMDIVPGDGVSLVGDAHHLPFTDNSITSMIYQAVLEHVRDPRLVIDEAMRVLKPGGYLYIEVPFLQGFHADPYDYQRYTLEGLRVLTKSFTEVDAGVSVGPCCSLVWIIRDGASSCFSNILLYAISRYVLAWALSPIRYCDYLIKNNPVAKRLACEYYMLCQKGQRN